MASTTTTAVKATANRYIMVLPTVGVPYITIALTGKKSLPQLQGLVGGWIATAPLKYYYVPDSFSNVYPKWATVAKMLKKSPGREIYCNDEGGYDCPENMALCMKDMGGIMHGLSPHLFGNVLIVLTQKKMDSYGIVPSEWAVGGLLASALVISGAVPA